MPGFGPIPVRFAAVVGWRSGVTSFWGACPQARPGMAEHISRADVASGAGPVPDGACHDAYETDVQLGPCEQCGTPWDGDRGSWSSSAGPTYNTPSGNIEPGSLWWGQCYAFHCPLFGAPVGPWGGFCDGTHVYAMLPDKHHWDIDSRASNCTRPGEPHRCWVRHNNPETETSIFTVDKEGDTCTAGAGSIDDGTYHGFLRAGAFTAG